MGKKIEERTKKKGFRKRPTSDSPDCSRVEGIKRFEERSEERAENVDPKKARTIPAEHGALSHEELSIVAGGVSGLGLGPQWKGLERILSRSALFRERRKKEEK